MSRLALILILVTAIAAVITRLEQVHGSRSAGTPVVASGWVRTVDGWEPREAVEVPTMPTRASLHPAVVASFLLVFSALALVAFSGRNERNDSAEPANSASS